MLNSMMASFHLISRSRSCNGSPNRVRNTCDGYGVASSVITSHSARWAIESMISIAWA
ncbi:Uncharacterised protein [Mycobacterium tuberculosis]|nr:Uncharacterised protein [Mycobacterium tuberculosis]